MRIIVCAKQVPDTTEVRIDPVSGTLIREGVPSILNPDDANALEEALKLKDSNPRRCHGRHLCHLSHHRIPCYLPSGNRREALILTARGLTPAELLANFSSG